MLCSLSRDHPPLQHLKVEHLGNKNPRLHVNEALIALAVCAVSDPVASRAMEALNDLAGSEAHDRHSRPRR